MVRYDISKKTVKDAFIEVVQLSKENSPIKAAQQLGTYASAFFEQQEGDNRYEHFIKEMAVFVKAIEKQDLLTLDQIQEAVKSTNPELAKTIEIVIRSYNLTEQHQPKNISFGPYGD